LGRSADHPAAHLCLAVAAIVWWIGLRCNETGAAGAVLATKTLPHVFVAYLNVSSLPPNISAPRSRLILSYPLCGFANFGSLGIVIGGLGVMVPECRHEVVRLGMRTILCGTPASSMSGAVAGIWPVEGEGRWRVGDPAYRHCAASWPRHTRRRHRQAPAYCAPEAMHSMQPQRPPLR